LRQKRFDARLRELAVLALTRDKMVELVSQRLEQPAFSGFLVRLHAIHQVAGSGL
jgi:hypothetical protein